VKIKARGAKIRESNGWSKSHRWGESNGEINGKSNVE
jgi:hypothetical protein